MPSPRSSKKSRTRSSRSLSAAKADLKGKGAIVTGAATGIGRAMALEFARRGCGVAFNYVELPGRDVAVQAAMTEAVLKSLNVPVFCDRCDVRKKEEVDRFVQAANNALGGVQILVNNAGISRDAALWRMDDTAWQDVVETNLTGAFNMIRSVAPLFRAQHYGKIVNVAAVQAMKAGFGIANYAASKAGLIGLTHAAAVELGPANVNVNAVAPGFVKTELTAAPLGGAGRPCPGQHAPGTPGRARRRRPGHRVPLHRRRAPHHRRGRFAWTEARRWVSFPALRPHDHPIGGYNVA